MLQAKTAHKLARTKLLDSNSTDRKDLLNAVLTIFIFLVNQTQHQMNLQESKRTVNEHHQVSYNECDNVMDTDFKVET